MASHVKYGVKIARLSEEVGNRECLLEEAILLFVETLGQLILYGRLNGVWVDEGGITFSGDARQ